LNIKNWLKDGIYFGTVTYSVLNGKFKYLEELFDRVYLLTCSHKNVSNRLKQRKKGIFGSNQEQREYTLKNKQRYEQIIKQFNPIIINTDNSLIETIKSLKGFKYSD
jgi:thymidylate kinase